MLNKYQVAAISETENHVVVHAAPGSGKTTLLCYKIKHLIENCEASPAAITVLTHTNVAVDAMKEKCKAIGHDVNMLTIHSFALSIVRSHNEEYKLISDQKLKLEFVKLAAEQTGFKNPKRYSSQQIYNFMWQSDNLTAGTAKHISIHNLVQSYMKILDSRLLVCHNMAIVKATEVINNNGNVGNGDEMLYLVCDEYQDCSKSQHELIMAYVRHNKPTCTIVGDEDQYIFGFGSGEPVSLSLTAIGNALPSCYVMYLPVNYRSTSAVVELAEWVINADEDRRTKPKMIAARESEPPTKPPPLPQLVECSDENKQYKLIAEYISRFVPADQYRRVAVLCRQNADVSKVTAALQCENVQWNVGRHLSSSLMQKKCLAWLMDRCRNIFAKADSENKYWSTQEEDDFSVAKILRLLIEDNPKIVTAEVKALLPDVFALAGTYNSLLEFINCASDADDADQEVQGVYVGTVHSAKGLEFRIVFIVNCDTTNYPTFYSSYAEDLRMLYVAATRAEDFLVLLYRADRVVTTYINTIPETVLMKCDDNISAPLGMPHTVINDCTVNQQQLLSSSSSSSSSVHFLYVQHANMERNFMICNTAMELTIGRNELNHIYFVNAAALGRYDHATAKLCQRGSIRVTVKRDSFAKKNDGTFKEFVAGKTVTLGENCAELYLADIEGGDGVTLSAIVKEIPSSNDLMLLHSNTSSVEEASVSPPPDYNAFNDDLFNRYSEEEEEEEDDLTLPVHSLSSSSVAINNAATQPKQIAGVKRINLPQHQATQPKQIAGVKRIHRYSEEEEEEEDDLTLPVHSLSSSSVAINNAATQPKQIAGVKRINLPQHQATQPKQIAGVKRINLPQHQATQRRLMAAVNSILTANVNIDKKEVQTIETEKSKYLL